MCSRSMLAVGVFASLVASASAVRQYDIFGQARKMRSSPGVLLMIGDVKKELKLTGAQSKAAGKVAAELQKAMNALMRGSGDDANPMGTMKAMADATAKADADTRAILTAEQNARLRELQYQALGSAALFEPDLQVRLGLSPETIEKLTAEEKARRTRAMDAMMKSGRDPKALGRTLDEIMKANDAAVFAILTEAQTAAYKGILGKPIKALENLARSPM